MRKLFTIILLTVSFNTNAFEFESGFDRFADSILTNVGKNILKRTIDSTVRFKNSHIHTDTAIERGKFTKCWSSPVYNGQGIPKYQLVCY